MSNSMSPSTQDSSNTAITFASQAIPELSFAQDAASVAKDPSLLKDPDKAVNFAMKAGMVLAL